MCLPPSYGLSEESSQFLPHLKISTLAILVSLNTLPLAWTTVLPGCILSFLPFYSLPNSALTVGFFFQKLVSLPCLSPSFEHTSVHAQRSCYKDQSFKTNSKYLLSILSLSSLFFSPCLKPPQSFFLNELTIARGRALMHSPFLCLKCLYPKSSSSQLYHTENVSVIICLHHNSSTKLYSNSTSSSS